MSQTPEFVPGDEFAKVLTETTMSLVCVLDRDGRIRLFNDACERVTGFTRDEVMGSDARDLVIPPEEAEAFSEVLGYVWSTGLSSPQVGHWLTKDGQRKLIAWSNRLMPSEDEGGSALLVTTGIDLSASPTADERGQRYRPGPQNRGSGADPRLHRKAGSRGGQHETDELSVVGVGSDRRRRHHVGRRRDRERGPLARRHGNAVRCVLRARVA